MPLRIIKKWLSQVWRTMSPFCWANWLSKCTFFLFVFWLLMKTLIISYYVTNLFWFYILASSVDLTLLSIKSFTIHYTIYILQKCDIDLFFYFILYNHKHDIKCVFNIGLKCQLFSLFSLFLLSFMGPITIFWYYLWISLYYFNYFYFIYSTLSKKSK